MRAPTSRRCRPRGARRPLPKHSETRALPYSPEQMFDLVADVGRYQEFLPWVIGTRVRTRDDHGIVADLIVGFKALRETFSSRVLLERPDHIHVEYLEGPLKFLHNDWRFRPDGQGGCLVDFMVEFEFRSRVFEAIAGTIFGEAVRKMVGAFEMRAAKLYEPAAR